MTRWVKLALGLAVAGQFLWLALSRVDLSEVALAARNVDAARLALAPVMLAAGYACRVLRWRLMLVAQNPDLRLRDAAVPFLASIAVNNLAPFRLGDVMRCFAFSRWLGVVPGAVLASVLVERLLDMVALILALALALWVFSVDGGQLGLGLGGVLTLFALGLVGLVLVLSPGLVAGLVGTLVALAARLGQRTRAEAALRPVATGLQGLSDRRVLAGALALSLPVWGFEGATYWAVAQALAPLDQPQVAWLAMPVGTLATLLPSTPGHLGTFDFFVQEAALALGNPVAAATAFTLLVHAVLWLTTTLAGGLCLAIWALAPGRAP